MTNAIIVINYWGGIPGCMIKKSLNNLNHFKSFSLGGDCYTNAYVTNTNPIESFKDFICNKHTNGFPFNKNDSIFHIFKKNGFHTVLLGCFGLDENFDPNPIRREYINDTRYSLESIGVDRFSSQDGAYHTGSAYSHDEKVLNEANEILSNVDSSSPPLFLFINLLGCNDCYHRRFNDPSIPQTKRGIGKDKWYLNPDVNDIRLVPTNIDSKKINDWKHIFEASKTISDTSYGEITQDKIDNRIKFLSLQSSAWKDLIKIDDLIIKILRTARQKFVNITTSIVATNVIPLEEHNIRYEAPIESSCRSFWTYSRNELDRPVEEHSITTNILSFWDEFLEREYQNKISTLCLIPTSNIDMKTLCLRKVLNVRGKTYSINYLWSINDILKANNASRNVLDKKVQWKLIMPEIASVFDLIEDVDEINNILALCSTDLLFEFSQDYDNSLNIFLNLKEVYKKMKDPIDISETPTISEKPKNPALLRAQKSRLQVIEKKELELEKLVERREIERREIEKREIEKREIEKREIERREIERREIERKEAESREIQRIKENTKPKPPLINEIKSPRTKSILKIDTNQNKIFEYDTHNEPIEVKKPPPPSKLRKRESDLNQRHR